MKLILRRRHRDKKGILGVGRGIMFILYAKVELTPEEQVLVDRYKAQDIPLGEYNIGHTDVKTKVDVKDLLKGYETMDIPYVPALLEFEQNIKDACLNLKNILTVIASFDGEEVIEY